MPGPAEMPGTLPVPDRGMLGERCDTLDETEISEAAGAEDILVETLGVVVPVAAG